MIQQALDFVEKVHDNEFMRRYSPMYNRKFYFAICVLVSGTWLCANGKMSGEAWSYFALGLGGIYITGNVWQKNSETKAENTTTITTPTQEGK